MRFLVIGLGSMGKRRIRNLQSLAATNITGFDVRQDRRDEVRNIYSVKTIDNLESFHDFDAAIISTAPGSHNGYIRMMITEKKPCFVELSLLMQDLPELSRLALSNNVIVAPSCTFRFHPSIRSIKEAVQSGEYGEVLNFSYHTGQHLADWHPWENIKDFFVSNKDTSGCKEILSLELRWILDVFGHPHEVFNFRQKTSSFDADIDDTYAVGMKFRCSVGLILVDIISRFATRSLIVNLQKAQLRWNWEEGTVRLYDAESKIWDTIQEAKGKAHKEYNAHLIEEMYIAELLAFIEAVQGGDAFIQSLEKDIEILRVLEKIDGIQS